MKQPHAFLLIVLSCLSLTLWAVAGTGEQQVPKAAQGLTAVEQLGVWPVGFHPMKEDPSQQMPAHHFCQELRPDLTQCVLYDSNAKNAKLIGIEYIIPMETYQKLPDGEQQYWHPHNFEILSGVLTAPGKSDEIQLFAKLMNSYGKTFHTWMAGVYGQKDEPLPLGAPRLMWSFNHLGEAREGLIESTYDKLGISVEQTRQERQRLASQARPQCGVNAIVERFEGPIKPLPGVEAQEGC